MTNAAKLRAISKKPGAMKIVGAYDALSARLIDPAGFDGIWAGGFPISASMKYIPDASFIDSSEQLRKAWMEVDSFEEYQKAWTTIR